jgi:methionyl-tRNA formyltransferase
MLGSHGPFSASVLNSLILKGISVSQIICAGYRPGNSVESTLPIILPEQDDTLDSLATRFHIPVSYISNASELPLLALKNSEKPDVVLVACFPFRLPDTLIHWPRIACLNLHPSLLPRYRGPDPIFWQLKKGESHTGISLHELTRDFDAGPVVKQKAVTYNDGAYKKEIEILLGHEGANLYSELISTDFPAEENSTPQNETDSSYFHLPSGEDFQLSPKWSARQAFNFVRGTWPPLTEYTIDIEGCTWIIQQALEYSSEGRLPGSVQKNNDELYIQFSPGILHARGYKA